MPAYDGLSSHRRAGPPLSSSRYDRPGAFDPGWDPPLRIAAETPRDPRPGRTQSRWLGASLLIGTTGGLLLGTALWTADQGDAPPAAPERMATAAHDTAAPGAARKADKLTRDDLVVVARRRFQAPTTERVGDHEVIKTHAYVDLATDLSPAATAFAAEIPPYDPTRLIDGGPGAAAPEPDLATSSDPSDAAVTLTQESLQYVAIPPDAPGLSDAAAAAQVRDAQVRDARRPAAEAASLPIGLGAQRLLSRSLRLATSTESGLIDQTAPDSTFRDIDVRVLPENLTTVAETHVDPAAAAFENRDVVLGPGETLAALLRRSGAAPERIAAIGVALSARGRGELTEGQHVRLLLAPEAGARAIERVTLYGESGIEEIVAADDRGRFVAVAAPAAGTTARALDEADEADGTGISLYESLYGTALRNGVPRPIIEDLVRALAFGIDLQQRASPGDRIALFFTSDEEHPELLFASVKFGDETRRLYRYRPEGGGEPDFFDEEGRSLRRFLMRRPVPTGRISSPFGARYHPILGYARMHNGVDWAAPRGTPIMAAGDGTVQAAGVHSGYGNRVEVVHANGYGSAYNHMSRIANGIVPGAHVRLGQVIGFVGTTGLSTGPHVHYEVTINGRFVDPMRIRLPSGRELAGAGLAAFRAEAAGIDALRRRGTGIAVAQHG